MCILIYVILIDINVIYVIFVIISMLIAEVKMEIVITSWALNSYLDLVHNSTICYHDYKSIIRPDVKRLEVYPADPKFNNSKFWSIATDSSKNRITDGYKMKWHNLGNGKIQLRLPVGLFTEAYLCEAIVKGNEKEEHRHIARFKTHLDLIRRKRVTECGRLS